jgi:hypothetical protein
MHSGNFSIPVRNWKVTFFFRFPRLIKKLLAKISLAASVAYFKSGSNLRYGTTLALSTGEVPRGRKRFRKATIAKERTTRWKKSFL